MRALLLRAWRWLTAPDPTVSIVIQRHPKPRDAAREGGR